MSWVFVVARTIFLVITTIVFVISFSAYLRFRSRKALFLAIGFGLFFVHGVIAVPEIFNITYNKDFTDSIHILIDATAILLVLIGVFQDQKDVQRRNIEE